MRRGFWTLDVFDSIWGFAASSGFLAQGSGSGFCSHGGALTAFLFGRLGCRALGLRGLELMVSD